MPLNVPESIVQCHSPKEDARNNSYFQDASGSLVPRDRYRMKCLSMIHRLIVWSGGNDLSNTAYTAVDTAQSGLIPCLQWLITWGLLPIGNKVYWRVVESKPGWHYTCNPVTAILTCAITPTSFPPFLLISLLNLLLNHIFLQCTCLDFLLNSVIFRKVWTISGWSCFTSPTLDIAQRHNSCCS